ncbi:MAG: universal stress protein [Candidatus Omnitrophica bacterium]|nr:universal stress protein [Candidatus Omnitrophota bacterium]MCM8823404.1 universal stress protein [Candidatus Omnitrophota bacterium]MCM8826361.1 universal stress protein [Candidatus Omnitrophota bacterium]
MKNIVVPVEGGILSLVTAKYAIYLAKHLEAKLFFVYVIDEKVLSDLLKVKVFVDVEAKKYEEELEVQGRRFLDKVKKMAESKNVPCEQFILRGVVHDQIVKKIREVNAELLVMGNLREALSRREIFYDEGERIFREAHCPVVVVKSPEIVERLYNEL